MIKFLIFLFFDLKGFSSGYALTDYSYPFSLLFEGEIYRPYFSLNFHQFKKGTIFKDSYYSFAFGYNVDSLYSLRSTLSSEFSKGKNYLNDFSLLTGKKFSSSLSGFLGFYGIIEEDLKIISGFKLFLLNPFNPGFFETSIIGPGIKKFDFKFLTRVVLNNIETFKKVNVKNLGFSFGKFEDYFGGFALEFILFEKLFPGIGVFWKEAMAPYPSLFVSYYTSFVEKTDYLLQFSIHFLPENDTRYSLSFNILSGDDKWKEKEKERKRKERENLAKLLSESERKYKEAEKLYADVNKLNEEIEKKRREVDSLRNIVEKEKEEVRKMREEAFEALKKIEGIKIQEEKEFIKITATEKAVHFEIGGTGLQVESILTLKNIANFLRSYPRYKVKVYGHTDNIPIGPLLKSKYKDNFELSKARAKAVVDYFIKIENLSNLEFEYEGFGDREPIASNETEEGRAQNRRVEIIIEKK
ncbi:MAG: OmpA family protein [candidate division WOR-3 bacterium]